MSGAGGTKTGRCTAALIVEGGDSDDRRAPHCHRGVCRNPTCPDLPSQDTEGGTEHMVFEADCSGTQSQVVPPQKAYVSAQLTRHDPTGAWTGAVAGIVITVQ